LAEDKVSNLNEILEETRIPFMPSKNKGKNQALDTYVHYPTVKLGYNVIDHNKLDHNQFGHNELGHNEQIEHIWLVSAYQSFMRSTKVLLNKVISMFLSKCHFIDSRELSKVGMQPVQIAAAH